MKHSLVVGKKRVFSVTGALLLLVFVAGGSSVALSANGVVDAKTEVIKIVDTLKQASESMAMAFWNNPELGYLETKSSQRMQQELRKAGFSVDAGIAGIPTAFVASYGSGEPVIGILAEMDALPGKSQAAVPQKQQVKGLENVHSCGHHLFGAGSTTAAIAIKQWLQQSGQKGTIRLYGTPAEEGGSSKVYLVREGLFEDVDVVLQWHPGGVNAAYSISNNAVISAKFRFHGKASHAAVAPQNGRSALDGVEVMNFAINMMREHMSTDARVHYVISNGGELPNTVPDFSEVYYYAREKSAEDLKRLWERILKASEGAALATGTKVDHEVIHGTHNLLINNTLNKELTANLSKRSVTIQWSSDEREFARKIYSTLEQPWIGFEETETTTLPHRELKVPGSSDVGDVSWVVPTGGFIAATWAPATDPHTWQAAAAGGTGIGLKGMHVASEVLAMTAVSLFLDESLLSAATAEFTERRGIDFKYEPLLGNRQPPLDYRVSENNRSNTN